VPLRRWVVGEAAGRMIEFGGGTGNAFRYDRPDLELVAIEPDPYMRRRARRRAAALRRRVGFHAAPAEVPPFPEASVDAVVCTLALCTVVDPPRALGEVRRILKPEGTFRFIEHVRGGAPGPGAGPGHAALAPPRRRPPPEPRDRGGDPSGRRRPPFSERPTRPAARSPASGSTVAAR